MPRRMPAAERDALFAKVVQLRRARTPWDQIAKQIERTPARAHQIYQEALTANPLTAIQVDEHRVEETELIDLAVRQLMLTATKQGTTDRNRIDAWRVVIGASERKSKLLGLDAPTRHEVVTLDALDAQIQQLEAEIGARVQVAEGESDAIDAEIAHLEAQLAGGDPSS